MADTKVSAETLVSAVQGTYKTYIATDTGAAPDSNAATMTQLQTFVLGATGLTWSDWTPTITAQAGTFTTVSGTGRYARIGKVIFVIIVITITTNGTAASWIKSTLPVNAATTVAPLLNAGDSSAALSGFAFIAGASQVNIFRYDGAYPGADAKTIRVSGVYEAA